MAVITFHLSMYNYKRSINIKQQIYKQVAELSLVLVFNVYTFSIYLNDKPVPFQ